MAISEVRFFIELSPNVKVALPLRRQQNGLQLLGPAYQAYGDLRLAKSPPQLSLYKMTLHINCGLQVQLIAPVVKRCTAPLKLLPDCVIAE